MIHFSSFGYTKWVNSSQSQLPAGEVLKRPLTPIRDTQGCEGGNTAGQFGRILLIIAFIIIL